MLAKHGQRSSTVAELTDRVHGKSSLTKLAVRICKIFKLFQIVNFKFQFKEKTFQEFKFGLKPSNLLAKTMQ